MLKTGTDSAAFLLCSNCRGTYLLLIWFQYSGLFFINFIVTASRSYTSEFCCGFISFLCPFIFRVTFPAICMVATPQVLILNFSIQFWHNGIFKWMCVIWKMYALMKSISSTDKSFIWIPRWAYSTRDEQVVWKEPRIAQRDCLLPCDTNSRHLKVDIETRRNHFKWYHAESSIDYCQNGGFIDHYIDLHHSN